MYIDKLNDYEDRVRESGLNGAFEMAGFSLSVPGEDLVYSGRAIAPSSGFQGYFYNEQHEKTNIVLHFTVGVLPGDLRVLMDPERGHVSVAFVLARDGTVYRPFSSAAWSYHLGRSALGGNTKGSKKSIGIEISNLGPLTLEGSVLKTAYGQEYCSLADTDFYIRLDAPYRTYEYWAAYTEVQYNSLIILLRYLTTEYGIPRAFLPQAQRFETTPEVVGFKGIVSHVNYRPDKFDIGPAFDWQHVIDGVTAPTYTSTAPMPRGVERSLFVPSEHDVDNAFQPTDDNEFRPDQYGEDGPEVPDIENVRFSEEELDAELGIR